MYGRHAPTGIVFVDPVSHCPILREVDMREWLSSMRAVTIFLAGVVVGTLGMQSTGAQENIKTGLRLNHVGIAVKDFQESLNYYTKVMGFRVAFGGMTPDGKPGTVYLQISRDTFLEMAPATAA